MSLDGEVIGKTVSYYTGTSQLLQSVTTRVLLMEVKLTRRFRFVVLTKLSVTWRERVQHVLSVPLARAPLAAWKTRVLLALAHGV